MQFQILHLSWRYYWINLTFLFKLFSLILLYQLQFSREKLFKKEVLIEYCIAINIKILNYFVCKS